MDPRGTIRVQWIRRLAARCWHDPVWSRVIGTLISCAILALLGWVANCIPSARAQLASCIEIASDFVTAHTQLLQWLFMAATVILLLSYVQKLRRHLKDLQNQAFIVLDKSASSNISNWDYIGGWSANEGILDITNSDNGGLLKWGTEWKDYDFNFDFKIVDAYAAWIVRAQGHRRYVMLQCDGNLIRPHTRTATIDPHDPERGRFEVLDNHPHGISLKEWNEVKTQVRENLIQIFINDQLAFEHPTLLQDFASGTVGFRCSGPEHALFKNIKVIQKANSRS
jgi:hypothetical protein